MAMSIIWDAIIFYVFLFIFTMYCFDFSPMFPRWLTDVLVYFWFKIDEVLTKNCRSFGLFLVAFRSPLVALWSKIYPSFVRLSSDFGIKPVQVLSNSHPVIGLNLPSFCPNLALLLVYLWFSFSCESVFLNSKCSSALAFFTLSKMYRDSIFCFHSFLLIQLNSFD